MNNYHTHTYRCRHASGEVFEYAQAAIDAGLSELGISDHVPFPDGEWAASRMDISELPVYLQAIADARDSSAERLRILSGFECEWRADMHEYLKDLSQTHSVDYLVAGVHWFPFEGDWFPSTRIERSGELLAFTEYTVKTIESGLFSFLAHPDVFCAAWPVWNRDSVACARAILEAAADRRLPLEINGYGLRKPYVSTADGYRPQYPYIGFWELAAEYDIEAIVNSDAHRPMDVAAGLEEGRELAARFGIPVLETLNQTPNHAVSRP